MSAVPSILLEKTLSQSSGPVAIRSFRTHEDELIVRINGFRLKITSIKEQVEKLIAENSNPQTCTIYLKDINKTIKYGSSQDLDKLMRYLGALAEMKLTIPDLTNTPMLNALLARLFGPGIEHNRGLLNKDPEIDDKLRKKIPSRNYEGLFIHDIDLTQNMDSVILYLILEEFFILNSKTDTLEGENLTLETYSSESLQQISMLNPNFNAAAVYLGENKRSGYILFLTDSLEFLFPDQEKGMSRLNTRSIAKLASRVFRDLDYTPTNAEFRDHVPKKYDNAFQSQPDITLESCRRFVQVLDSDSDDKLSKNDIMNLVIKNNMAYDIGLIDEMFEDITSRRTVKFEKERYYPIDEKEIFNAIRLKYKKDPKTEEWITFHRPFRNIWLILLEKVGIYLPKYSLEKINPKQIKASYELPKPTFRPQLTKRLTQSWTKEIKKPPITIPYNPEAGILIQNTPNIQEMYFEEKNYKSAPNPNQEAFGKVINSKIMSDDSTNSHATVQFSTKMYYNEAVRLSMNPKQYLNEKMNPIERFYPANYNFIYKKQEEGTPAPSKRDYNYDEEDQSMNPHYASNNRTTPMTLTESNHPPPMKKVTTTRSIEGPLTSPRRELMLSSSMKTKKSTSSSGFPVFITRVKNKDNHSIKIEMSKNEGVDPYSNPVAHVFRDDNGHYSKPIFVKSWKNEIPEFFGNYVTMSTAESNLPKIEKGAKANLKEITSKEKIDPWIRVVNIQQSHEKYMSGQPVQFLDKGEYVDGMLSTFPFIREEPDLEVPFKLAHRALRKTDKNLFFGDVKGSHY